VKTKGIIFYGAEVEQILDGAKRSTRRPVYISDYEVYGYGPVETGDILWVREPHAFVFPEDSITHDDRGYRFAVKYSDQTMKYVSENARAWAYALERRKAKMRPSIYMPKWASRLSLSVEKTRLEKLQDITDRSAIREGFDCIAAFREWWDDVLGLRAYRSAWYLNWDLNPDVLVIEFSVVKPNA